MARAPQQHIVKPRAPLAIHPGGCHVLEYPLHPHTRTHHTRPMPYLRSLARLRAILRSARRAARCAHRSTLCMATSCVISAEASAISRSVAGLAAGREELAEESGVLVAADTDPVADPVEDAQPANPEGTFSRSPAPYCLVLPLWRPGAGIYPSRGDALKSSNTPFLCSLTTPGRDGCDTVSTCSCQATQINHFSAF